MIIVSNFVYTKGLYNLINSLVLYYKSSFNDSINLYKNINMNNLDQIKMIIDNLKTEYVLSMIPGNVVVTSMITSFFIYKFTESQFRKNGLSINKLKPFAEWHIGDIFAAIAIALVSIGIILKSRDISLGMYILNSSLIAGVFLFTILGISITVYFLTRKFKISKFMVTIIVILTFMMQFGNVFLFLGISDSIINFRKLKYKNKA